MKSLSNGNTKKFLAHARLRVFRLRSVCYIHGEPFMRCKRILVRSSAGTYSVVCGTGAADSLATKLAALGEFTSVQILSSPRVWRLFGRRVLGGLGGRKRARVHLFPDAEASKTLRSVELLARSLCRSGADRHSLIVAVGGCVVGDVAGFVAATYLRGVSLVHVPTTLVAQTDSAIGGKTGVNLPEGKNLVGAFYPPRLVLAHPARPRVSRRLGRGHQVWRHRRRRNVCLPRKKSAPCPRSRSPGSVLSNHPFRPNPHGGHKKE